MSELGPYRILRALAVGGQAEILLGELDGPGGFVVQHALKVLKVPLGGRRPVDIPEARSLIAEARLLAQLSHPHTLAIHGLHVFDDRLVMVMEYVAGRSLATLLRRLGETGEMLPVEHALWVARCVLMSLDRAHSLRDQGGRPLNVVHRDVNPQNIILGFEGQIKLIDFGIAISRLSTRDTRFGMVKGKLAYMAPEQAYGAEDIDHRADIYALALVLYEMVTGIQALAGGEDSALDRARNPSIPQARRHKARLPATIDAILARGLARKPERRFQSAREMMVASSELLHNFNPRFCGDEMGPFVRAVLRDEFSNERRQRPNLGTQVVHEDELGGSPTPDPETVSPDELDYDPETLRFNAEHLSGAQVPEPERGEEGAEDDPFRQSRRHHMGLRRIQEIRRIGDEPTVKADEPPPSERSAVRFQPELAAGRTFQPDHPVVSKVDDALDLGDLLRAIEDIYKRRSGEEPEQEEGEDSTMIFRRE